MWHRVFHLLQQKFENFGGNFVLHFLELLDRLTYWLKLISGNVEYSDCFCLEFLLGNVQKNALASKQDICSCVNDTEQGFCLFNSGKD